MTNTIKFLIISGLIFFTASLKSFAQNSEQIFSSGKSTSKTQLNINQKEEIRLCWDDSVNNHSVGLTQGGVFTAGVRFDADTISHYLSYKLTRLSIYIGEIPTSASIKVWQGNNQSNLTEYVNQPFAPADDSTWYDIELEEPYVIDASKELWFGVRFEHEANIKPAGADTLTNALGMGNLVKIEGSEWTTLTQYQIRGDWNIQAVIDTFIIEGFKVTFNVNMTNAIFGNESELFDPRTHDVYISGTFNEWTQPGTNDDYKLSLIFEEPEEGELPTTLWESWEDYPEFTQDLAPWITVMTDSTETWQFNAFDFPGEGSKFSFLVFNPDSTNPAATNLTAKTGDKFLIAVQSQVPNDDKWLISPQIKGTSISKLSFWAKSLTHVYGAERFQVLISLSDTARENFVMISEGEYIEAPLEWTNYEYDLSAYDGQPFYFAIRYVSEDALMLMIDDIEVSGYQTLPDQWIYTTHFYLDEGPVEYKYFVVKDEPTWSYGEWEGDPNRKITVLEDRTIDDIWGVPVGVDEVDNSKQLTKIFPNPSSDIVNIEHQGMINGIRVFDISGRMVYSSSNINSSNAKVDVSGYSKGIYVIQLITKDAIVSSKFVVR